MNAMFRVWFRNRDNGAAVWTGKVERMRKNFRLLCCLGVTLFAIACARNDPPGLHASSPAAPHSIGVNPATASSVVPTATAAIAAAPSPPVTPEATPPAIATADAATTPPVPNQHQETTLVDSAGQPLPQTEQRPRSDDASFQKRVLQLCDAIISGTPAKAHDAFFPLLAYAQVKAIADPERDYRLRLLAHFDRDILNYHRRISKRPGPLRCAGATVPDNLARWMKPGSEYNRVAYFRVLRSRLNLTDAAQNTISLEVTSLISWRGQWYVVHLDGFE